MTSETFGYIGAGLFVVSLLVGLCAKRSWISHQGATSEAILSALGGPQVYRAYQERHPRVQPEAPRARAAY